MLPGYFLSGIFQKRISTQVHDYNFRYNNIYTLPMVRHEFAKQTVSYKIPFFFNNINSEIKEKIYSHSLIGYKLYVKKKIIQSYPSECLIVNCYICNRI